MVAGAELRRTAAGQPVSPVPGALRPCSSRRRPVMAPEGWREQLASETLLSLVLALLQRQVEKPP